jgi:AAA15 family ATPase/GTPase
MNIRKLRIKNFKSIKELDLDCKRINVFIGEPNTGKSNILEIIGLLSHVRYGNGKLANFVRFESLLDLFYDRNIGDPITIQFDEDCRVQRW